ncbi:hypothetical protein CspeluHIS016_0212090 [Cutaneotrichosporon spelunceum]|uniref:NAD(P)-binding protein n=1 Tax=Cutaneotrichosporon spelunceum TaxID=1672016 RepID=A0AAD3YBJ0_9TREE|nr:hypothetical protein CspeluHIS016_0212090 [Cutaneotrichosporon spelunceum]
MSPLYKISDSPITEAVSFLNNVVIFNPVVTGLVLVLLASGPDDATVKAALTVFSALGLACYLNSKLSELAANSYRLTAAPGWDWPREVAVVTGGSSGIGLAIVERFVRRGIKVAVLDVQDFPKSAQNRNVRFYKCDVTSPESVAQAADGVCRDLGDPSILINNAGITKPMFILEMPEDFLEKILRVNTMSHWTLVKQFLPAMVKKNKGHIVTVASVASFVALSGGADYSCTKASALAFHEALAAELKAIYKAPNVLATVIDPNFVATREHVRGGELQRMQTRAREQGPLKLSVHVESAWAAQCCTSGGGSKEKAASRLTCSEAVGTIKGKGSQLLASDFDSLLKIA